MRRVFLIVGVLVLILLVIVGGLFFYAATNLNSIIAQNRDYLLAKVSDSLGRKVEVGAIKVKLGWGIGADLMDVKIADDPAISKQPFVQARDVYADLEFLPLLSRELDVTKVVLASPEVRIIRTASGELNISTLGKHGSAPAHGDAKEPPAKTGAAPEKPAKPLATAPVTAARPESAGPSGAASIVSEIFVRSFEVDSGRIFYEDRSTRQPPVTINDVDLLVQDFAFRRPFHLQLKLAAFGQKQNLRLVGVVGPLGEGQIDVAKVPLQLKTTVGPLLLADLRRIGPLAGKIPDKLVLTGPVTLAATARGSLEVLGFSASSDLSGDQVAWGDVFSKPADVPFKVALDGSRRGSKLAISRATMTLADLDLKATQVRFGQGALGARLDTNRFALAPIAKLIPAATKYGPAGDAEMHTDLSLAGGKPSAKGTITLANVSVTQSGQSKPMVSAVSGDIRLDGNSADAGPLTFALGSTRATATVHAGSIQPLNATYNLTADSVKLADLVPKRPADEHLNKLSVAGTVASGAAGALAVTAKVTSADGLLQNIDYHALDVSAALANKTLDLKSLKVGAFGGQIAASGEATLASKPSFALTMNADSVNLEKLLESQKSKAADMVRGILTGQVKVSGAGANFNEIKPTLDGSGGAHVKNGKLVGVNVAADALGKIQNLPAIGALVPQSVIQRHPELFKNPNTDIQDMSLTFTIKGPRLTSHDLLIKTQDYALHGDGWFDMDKNVDLLAHILLSKQFSNELIAEKKNVVYLTDRQGEIDIPLTITGALPKPTVMPDVTEMAQRAGKRAVEQKGRQEVEKFLGNKGLGGILGGPSGGAASPGASPTPGTPLKQLQKLF